jgi:hypothetical protein
VNRRERLAVAVVAVGVATVVVARRAAPPREIHWQRADTGAAALPPPPLGAAGSAAAPAGAAPRVLRVDSSGCAPVAETPFAGVMSLDSVALTGGIPVENLIRGLHLPDDVPRSRPLSEMMKAYRFTLQDVQRVVEDYLKHCE